MSGTVAGLIQHLQEVLVVTPEAADYQVDMEGQGGISYTWCGFSELYPNDETLELEN